MALTEAQAGEELTLITDATSWPQVASAEVVRFVRQARRVDAAGLLVTDALWTATYDLNWAAAKIMRLKAMRTSAAFDVSTDGNTYTRSQLQKQFLTMAQEFSRKVSGSAPIASSTGRPLGDLRQLGDYA